MVRVLMRRSIFLNEDGALLKKQRDAQETLRMSRGQPLAAGPAPHQALRQGTPPAAKTRDVGRLLDELAGRATDVIYRYAFTPRRGLEFVNPAIEPATGYQPE